MRNLSEPFINSSGCGCILQHAPEMSSRQAGRDSKSGMLENPPLAAEPIVTRLLLRRADCDAGAGLVISKIISTSSLEAGHSVRDQVLEIERYPVQFEGFARQQNRRAGHSTRHSAIGALEHSRLPGKRGHGLPPGAPVSQVLPVTKLGPVAEIDGGRSGGNQLERKQP